MVTTEYDNPTNTITVPQTTVFSTTTKTVAHIWRREQVRRQLTCSGADCAKPTEVDIPALNFTRIAIATPIDVIAPAPFFNGTKANPLYSRSPSAYSMPTERSLIEPAPSPFLSITSTNPGPTPITDNPVPSILADCATNASIASTVFSACSCLRIKPNTVDVTPTVQTVCRFFQQHGELI